MNQIAYKIATWPKNKAGEPILSNCLQASFYGVLASNHPDEINFLNHLISETYEKIIVAKRATRVNFKDLAHLSEKATYFRLAYDEAIRMRGIPQEE